VFSPDGRRVLSTGGADRVDAFTGKKDKQAAAVLWDSASGNVVRSWLEYANQASFSPDGKLIALAGSESNSIFSEGRVLVVEAETGKEKMRFLVNDLKNDKPGQDCKVAVFSPDSKYIAAGLKIGSVHLLDLRSQKEIWSAVAHSGEIRALAFNPDGKRLVSGGGDRDVKLWDVATGQEILRLRAHTDAVHSLAFTPDGHRLISAGKDRTLRIWNATPIEERPESDLPPGAWFFDLGR
jgi:WD40 repeat protein